METSSSCNLFNDLPYDVVDGILCSLEIMDLLRFSAVSKLCRNLSFSVHSLLIRVPSGDLRPSLCDSIDNFMERRRVLGKITLNIRILSSSTNCELSCRIQKWLFSAANPRLRYLAINLGKNANNLLITLPGCLSGLKSLIIIAENIVTLRFPMSSSSGFESMRELVLRCVEISFEYKFYFERLISLLDNLHLWRVRGLSRNTTIRSKSLKCIEVYDVEDISSLIIQGENLKNLGIYWKPNTEGSLEVSAPDLERLVWLGYIPDQCSFIGSSMPMVEATISLRPHRFSMLVTEKVKWHHDFSQFFHSVRKIKFLTLDIDTMKVFNMLGCLPTPSTADLNKLRVLTDIFEGFEVPALKSFLQGCPNLTDLYFYGPRMLFSSVVENNISQQEHDPLILSTEFDVKYWESRNLKFVHNLRNVDIDISWGSTESEFLKYLFKHGEKLEKAEVFYPFPLSLERKIAIEEHKKDSVVVTYHHEKHKSLFRLLCMGEYS